MRVVAIVQARMGSTRLPGKALREIGGETMLAQVARRALRSELIDDVVVATTLNPADDAIIEECSRLGLQYFRGSEGDLLDRYCRAAEAFDADPVVRITSDCPLIDPEVIDKVIRAFLSVCPDYASNTLVCTYPRGLDLEVFKAAALKKAWEKASKPHERTHVTPYIYQHPESFSLLPVTGTADYSRLRWTVDTREDLEFVRAVYDNMASMGRGGEFSWSDVISLLESRPDLANINSHIRQKSLEEC